MKSEYTAHFTVAFHLSERPQEDLDWVEQEIQNWLFTRIVSPHDSLKNAVPSVCGIAVTKN